MVYGLEKESVRIKYLRALAIDEEVTSMMKNCEADAKRLKAIMQNYEEKKSDLTE